VGTAAASTCTADLLEDVLVTFPAIAVTLAVLAAFNKAVAAFGRAEWLEEKSLVPTNSCAFKSTVKLPTVDLY
jgi:hypothetical protein